MLALNLSAIGAGGTLTVSVLANTAKIYGREIALGAPPATPTQKAGGRRDRRSAGRPHHGDRMPATVKRDGSEESGEMPTVQL